MVISELISRMKDIQAKYGDCKVLIMSKSFYEGGTIIEAQDILLTSFPANKDSSRKEVVAMISNCPVVGAVPGTKEDAERILGVPRKDEPSDSAEDTEQSLVIQPQEFMLYFLLETEGYYVDYSDIVHFSDFVKRKYSDHCLDDYANIVIDLDHDAFVRSVQILPEVFDLAGDRVYLRSDDSFLEFVDHQRSVNPSVAYLVAEFVQELLKEKKI